MDQPNDPTEQREVDPVRVPPRLELEHLSDASPVSSSVHVDVARLLESSLDAFLSIDHHDRFSYLNPQAEAVLGRKLNDLANKNIWDAFPDALGTAFKPTYERARQGESVTVEEYLPSVGLWLEVHAHSVPEGVYAFFRDVTPLHEAVERAERLQSLVSSLLCARTTESTLEVITNQAIPALGGRDGAVSMVGDSNGLALVRHFGSSLADGELYGIGSDSAMSRAVDDKKALYISTMPSGDSSVEGPKAFAALPLVVEERVLGALAIGFITPRPFDNAERLYMDTVAAQCALALDRAYAQEAELRAQEEARRLAEVRHQVERDLRETEAKYQRLIENSLEGMLTISVDDIITYANPRLCHMLGYARGELTGRSIFDLFFDEDAAADRRKNRKRRTRAPQQYEIRLRCRDGSPYWVVASSSFILEGDALTGTFFTFTDINLRKKMETDLAAAYTFERRIAHSLQRTLLSQPSQEAFPELDIETLYRPAFDEASVGGDYYDVVPLEGGRIAFVVGDVSGKGLDAASRIAELKFTLRAYLREFPYPSNALARLNTFLIEASAIEEDPREYFVCLSLLILDPSSGEGSLVSAGIEAPVIWRGRQGEEIQTRGLPLGIQADAQFTSKRLRMEPGDVIIMTTDGVTEARRNGEFFGNHGIMTAAAAWDPRLSISELGKSIMDRAEEFVGGRLHDDACLLLARRRLMK